MSLIIVFILLFVIPLFVHAGSWPKIYRLDDYKVTVGQKVKIKGINFGDDEGKVKLWGVENDKAEILSWSDKRVVFRVPQLPAGARYKIQVCKESGRCSKTQKIYITKDGPELWRIKNESRKENYRGLPSDILLITGRNFNLKGIQVYFGDTQAIIVKKINKGKIKVRVPELARDKAYPVIITDGVNYSNGQDFYILP